MVSAAEFGLDVARLIDGLWQSVIDKCFLAAIVLAVVPSVQELGFSPVHSCLDDEGAMSTQQQYTFITLLQS